jgi:hypothetical protein
MSKTNTGVIVPDEVIMTRIYLIRGQKVMLDKDLAELYNVETRRLNEQVKRNLKRFPADFMFQLSEQETKILISQFATSSWGGLRKSPYAFTEHGVLMLSSVLNSDTAIEVNIRIMRIFMRFRQILTDNTELREAIGRLEKKTENNTKNIEVVFQYLDELLKAEKPKKDKPRKPIGYKLPKN